MLVLTAWTDLQFGLGTFDLRFITGGWTHRSIRPTQKIIETLKRAGLKRYMNRNKHRCQ